MEREGQTKEVLRRTAEGLAQAVGQRDGLRIALDDCAISTGKERARYRGEIRELKEDLLDEKGKSLGLVAKTVIPMVMALAALNPKP